MNDEQLFIGAYWKVRKENREQCAARVCLFLKAIEFDSLYSSWFLKGKTRKGAQIPVEVSIMCIEQILESNDKNPIGDKDLGYSFSVWNGNGDSPAAFSVTCGAFSPFVTNSAVLYMPPQVPPKGAAELSSIKQFFSKLVEVWEPDSAVFTSSEFIARAGGGPPWKTGGWLTYKK